jgi:hypothetical protein
VEPSRPTAEQCEGCTCATTTPDELNSILDRFLEVIA